MSLARYHAVMRNTPLLRALPDEALKLLAFGSHTLDLKPRQVLFEPGEAADGAVLVLGGQLRLVPNFGDGEGHVVSVGHLVDELALIIEKTRTTTAVAHTSCEILPLSRADMLRILSEYPDAAQRLQSSIAERAGALFSDVARLTEKLEREA
ncbi:MAG: cyclic nucleotide-binding domain-containing protein [Devosia sp.]